ncbi:MAG: DUF1697 domain-containing protein [Planktomarina sp.]
MTWITLLKGVNVGGKNILPMATLRAALADAGLQNVRTYIQSGNILHDGGNEDAIIAQILDEQFDIQCEVVGLSADTWKGAVETCPAPDDDPKLVHLYVPTNPTTVDTAALQAQGTAGEQVWWQRDILYLYTPNGFSRSKLAEKLPRLLSVPFTARNLNSARKILALSQQ